MIDLRRWWRSGALSRTRAMLVKEFVQLRRDRLTFATMIFIPIVQLLLFGYAINTTPRHLPTAVLVHEDSDLGRSVLAALNNTAYFAITHVARSEAEMDHWMRSGEVLFGIEIPVGFERGVRRGDKPALLLAADASDPVAASGALAALEGIVRHGTGARPRPAGRYPTGRGLRGAPASPLQSGRRHQSQHRAGSAWYHPHHDHADLHLAVGDARGRARHHGEPIGDADPAARNHAGQDRPLHHDRLPARRPDHGRRRAAVRRADRGQHRAAGGA